MDLLRKVSRLKNAAHLPSFLLTGLLVLGGATLISQRVEAADDDSMHGTTDDLTEEFVKKASSQNIFELRASELAEMRALDPQVKEFGEKMVTEHNKLATGLKTAVQTAGVPDTLIQTMVDGDQQEMLTELEQLKGEEFDEKYVELQNDVHDAAVDLFGKYAEQGEKPALVTFARNNLLVVKQHDTMVGGLD